MSTELINRITVKKDGVYVSSHSSNDTLPTIRGGAKGLSEVYAAEGQKGLDREVIRMLYEYARAPWNTTRALNATAMQGCPCRPCHLPEIYGPDRRAV